MTFTYFLVNIHINNQSTLYKVNGVVDLGSKKIKIATTTESHYQG
jgi:hypothetical protein